MERVFRTQELAAQEFLNTNVIPAKVTPVVLLVTLTLTVGGVRALDHLHLDTATLLDPAHPAIVLLALARVHRGLPSSLFTSPSSSSLSSLLLRALSFESTVSESMEDGEEDIITTMLLLSNNNQPLSKHPRL
eukprot:TRINITY_DN2840_c0_g2_i1.p2 TRINITY_DN2840_c0_g2~~TRINITY_DN2840_c0_g2_i1.p2  ORF type:complete len:133 (-),score=17.83 TRINITY_DN2840_c0_g2_i1:266-664(-)